MCCALKESVQWRSACRAMSKNVGQSPRTETTINNNNKPKPPPVDLKEHFHSVSVMNMAGENCRLSAPTCHQTMKLLKLSPAGRLTTWGVFLTAMLFRRDTPQQAMRETPAHRHRSPELAGTQRGSAEDARGLQSRGEPFSEVIIMFPDKITVWLQPKCTFS